MVVVIIEKLYCQIGGYKNREIRQNIPNFRANFQSYRYPSILEEFDDSLVGGKSIFGWEFWKSKACTY